MTKEKYYTMLKEGLNKVNKFNITVPRKINHKTKLYELKNLYLQLMDVNKFLFNPEITEWKDYKISVECNDTKKELDHKLNYCIVKINSTLRDILRDIDNIEFK